MCTVIYGQDSYVEKGLQSINSDAIRAQLGFLASDWMEGREAGEKGAWLAADYIAGMLQLYGVRPGGDFLPLQNYYDNDRAKRSFFQNFVMLKTVPGDKHILKIKTQEGDSFTTTDLIFNVDFSMYSPDQPIEYEAPVVFVGYGFRNQKIKYDDLTKADLKGKFILKALGYPSFADDLLTSSEINASVIESERFIKESGAIGILEFNPSSAVAGNPPVRDFMNPAPSETNRRSGSFSARYSLPGRTMPSDMIRINISAKTAGEILRGAGISFNEYLDNADSNSTQAIPVTENKSVYLKTDVSISQIPVRNVIGIIEGEKRDQIIVVGAHYDHMGLRDGFIWNGADDNASGCVGALMLAKAIMATGKKPEKTIIIALWTAEEKGLIGSRYYVNNLAFPLTYIRMNLNFDMISRYISDDNKNGVVMTYNRSCNSFKDITVNNLKKHKIDLQVNYQPSDNPSGGSDHRSFVEAGIPIMRFKPGHREEYHTPYDEIETVDWDILEKIIRISFANIWELANSTW